MDQDTIESMTVEQLEQNAMAYKRSRNEKLNEAQEAQSEASAISVKIDAIMSEIGKRNYSDMIGKFELRREHVKLLQKGSIEAVSEMTDLEIASVIDWNYDDNGLSQAQERNIARLISELPYAQDFINRTADGLVDMNKSIDGGQSDESND